MEIRAKTERDQKNQIIFISTELLHRDKFHSILQKFQGQDFNAGLLLLISNQNHVKSYISYVILRYYKLSHLVL